MAQPGGVQFTLSEIAARLGGDVLGDGQTLIRRIATLASADAGNPGGVANSSGLVGRIRGGLGQVDCRAGLLAGAQACQGCKAGEQLQKPDGALRRQVLRAQAARTVARMLDTGLNSPPTTMLKMAFVPLQCTAGSRTAIALAPCWPSMPKPASFVRLRSAPSGFGSVPRASSERPFASESA